MDKVLTVDVSFKNLSYTVPMPTGKGKNYILNSISGTFKSGELTAIMGPSGAGKSSLLNILTGFTKIGVTGDVKFGDLNKGKNLCSYILQQDNFFPWFTVEESMIFAATLKISNKSMTMSDKQVLIENILNTLHLIRAKRTKCSNLSGGQRKLLSIALELISNPPVLFLDEPTTGLDSSSAMDTVRLLQSLKQEGRTIVCTIHQPSASIYLMFDHIYALDKGQCVYQGTPQNTIPFLYSLNIECPKYHSTADFLLEVVTGEHGNFTKVMIEAAKSNAWRHNEDNESVESYHLSDNKNLSEVSCSTESRHTYLPPEWIRLWILIGRCHIQFYRDWTVTYFKLASHIICSIMIGLLFGDCGANAAKVITNIGLFLISIAYLWYTTMMPGIVRFPLEVAIIKRETFNNWYKLRTYYLATAITSIPVHIIFATVFSTITYLMTSQPLELERYIKFTSINIMITFAADGFGVLLGSVANPVNAIFLGAVLTCFKVIFSGFLILFEHMPSYLRIISYFSAHRYGLESLVVSVYGNGRADMNCPPPTIYCHLKNASLLLKYLGMTNSDYNFNIAILWLQISIFKSLAYFALKRVLRNGS